MTKFDSPKLAREVVVRDPVHGYIHLDTQVALEVVRSQEFQRMRRIKQLGPTAFVFPGATHTRFEHNLASTNWPDGSATFLLTNTLVKVPATDSGTPAKTCWCRWPAFCMTSAMAHTRTPLSTFSAPTMSRSASRSFWILPLRSTKL